jgi:hypothetical protein
MKIVAIGAHPDIGLGCGGLLLKAVRNGHFSLLTSYNDNARTALYYNQLPREISEWRREVPQENSVLKG